MLSRRDPAATLDRAFLEAAFHASSDGVVMLASDGTLLAINAAGAGATGFASPHDAVGRTWLDIWAGETREAAAAALEAARRGSRASFRAPVRRSQGPPTWWDSVVMPLRGAAGGSDRLLVISRDVTAQQDTERALDRSARLQQALIKATSEIVWHVDRSTGVSTRRGYYEFTGRQDDPADMDGWLEAVHAEDQQRAKHAADAAELSGKASRIEYRLRHRSGEWRWVEDHATPVKDDTGTVTDWVGIITDIHDRKSAEFAVLRSAEHLRLAIEATQLGTWDVDMRTGDRIWSSSMLDLMRLPRSTIPARRDFIERVHPDDRARVERELAGTNDPDNHAQVSVFRFYFGPNDFRWIEAHESTIFEAGVPIRRVGTLQDITERKQAEHEIWLAAHTDPLTGIANRGLFQSRLDHAVSEAETQKSSVGLLLVDLDHFKEVNDSLGHDVGDAMLREVANRILAQVPEAATVARLGGDEFGVIIPQPSAAQTDLSGLAEELLSALTQPLPRGDLRVDCSASIGWSVFPEQAVHSSDLFKNADVALYAAKSAGRSRAVSFVPAMQIELQRRLNVLRSAREALERHGTVPFYQPKVCLRTGHVFGFEALLRWTDAQGLHGPASLQEALDDPELSSRLGVRMLDDVARDMHAWNAAGVPFGQVALNVAAPEVQGGGLSNRVVSTLARFGIRPDQIEIEVTERVLLDDGIGRVETELRNLHAAGVAIALDDFGTGYASLTHLTRFPVSWVKIDKSFISQMGSDAKAAAIVEAVIGLAHKLQMRVVAEGLETAAQLAYLKYAGCDLGQGYLLAKPMSGSRVPHFLRTWPEKAARLFGAPRADLHGIGAAAAG